jgi:hypothetical protein
MLRTSLPVILAAEVDGTTATANPTASIRRISDANLLSLILDFSNVSVVFVSLPPMQGSNDLLLAKSYAGLV